MICGTLAENKEMIEKFGYDVFKKVEQNVPEQKDKELEDA